jgi:short subunit dehydrogenase-like uncharacterized protein
MSPTLVIYGVSGYSGGLVARRAAKLGWRPILCGRDAAKIGALETWRGLERRVASVSEPNTLADAFAGACAVLNAAGPFSQTASSVLDACLRTGAHYLDLSAEVPVIERLCTRDAEARARGIMIMPAVGFDVVATDCLAAHVARRLPSASRLALAVTNLFFVTRGSARTLLEAVDAGMIRRGGALVRVPLGSMEHLFDYEHGPRTSLNVSLADLTTAYHSTGIPNIETYTEATPTMRALLAPCRRLGRLLRTGPAQALLAAWTDMLPERPPASSGADKRTMRVVAEAEDDTGRRAIARLRTPEAYAFTPGAATAVIERVLAGDVEPGFQTPARVYGADFVLSLPGVMREDLT